MIIIIVPALNISTHTTVITVPGLPKDRQYTVCHKHIIDQTIQWYNMINDMVTPIQWDDVWIIPRGNPPDILIDKERGTSGHTCGVAQYTLSPIFFKVILTPLLIDLIV